MEDVPSIAFLIPRRTPSKPQLVGFHISLPMGYVNSAPYLCMDTKMVYNLANAAMDQRDEAQRHPLEEAADVRAADDAGAP